MALIYQTAEGLAVPTDFSWLSMWTAEYTERPLLIT